MTSPEYLSPEASKLIEFMEAEISQPEWNYEARTIANRKRDACSFIARWEAHFKRPFVNTTPEQIKTVLKVAAESGRAYDTLLDELSAMRLMYRVFMKLNDKITSNPFEGIKPPNKPVAGPRKKKNEPKFPLYFEVTFEEQEYLLAVAKGRTRQEALHMMIAENRAAAQVATSKRLLEQSLAEIKELLAAQTKEILDGLIGQLDLTEINLRALFAVLIMMVLQSQAKPIEAYRKGEAQFGEHGDSILGNLKFYTKWIQLPPEKRGPIRKEGA